MKFTEHLSAHITPEWRKQYIQYEAFKEMLYAAQDQAPSIEVTDEDTVKRYYAKFEEKFFQMCEKELAKINTFYSEKLAEAQRRFATLQNELQSSLDAQRESSASGLGLRRRKTVFALSQQERCKHRNIKDLQLAFSEFYLSLILLQNYQNLNFTGFRKILKKHDKILETSRGADWRVTHVEVAPFYTCKKITQLISETEALVTTELEGGDRQKAMKRLRVPPLGAAQVTHTDGDCWCSDHCTCVPLIFDSLQVCANNKPLQKSATLVQHADCGAVLRASACRTSQDLQMSLFPPAQLCRQYDQTCVWVGGSAGGNGFVYTRDGSGLCDWARLLHHVLIW